MIFTSFINLIFLLLTVLFPSSAVLMQDVDIVNESNYREVTEVLEADKIGRASCRERV